MFGTTSRPVPSNGALRALYQLAYISSGTAVGVAALCTEERRRRVQVLQKIADNAKRIRQSPRHVHNAAATTPGQDQLRAHTFGLGGPHADEGQDESDYWHYDPRHGPPDLSVRGPQLPSSVSRGYEQVSGNGRSDCQQREVTETPPSTSQIPHEDKVIYVPARPSPLVRKDFDPGPVRKRAKKAALGEAPKFAPQKTLKAGTQRTSLHDQPVAGSRAFGLELPAQVTARPTKAVDRKPKFLLIPGTHAGTTLWSDEDLSHDLDLFLRSAPWSSTDLCIEKPLSDELLRLVSRHGTLAQIQSILDWKVANHSLCLEDAVVTSAAASRLADHEKHDQLLSFYEELYRNMVDHSSMGADGPSRLFESALGVVSESSSWEHKLRSRSVPRKLLAHIVSSSSQDDLHSALNRVCENLMSQGKIQAAEMLLLVVSSRFDKISKSALLDISNTLYACLLESRYLTECSRVLIWKQAVTPDVVFKEQLETILLACKRQRSRAPMKNIVQQFDKDKWSSDIIAHLQPRARAFLAKACASSEHLSGVFDKTYSLVREAFRDDIDVARVVIQLQTTWRTTRDLAAVQREFEQAKTLRVQSGMSEEPFYAAEITLIEICNKANNTNLALDLLSRQSHNKLHHSRVLCLAAVSLAKKADWVKLDELLRVATTLPVFELDTDNVASLNEVVRLYSLRHSAAETWTFCTALVDIRGMVPNHATNAILLRKFVAAKDLSLIPKWIRYLKASAHGFELDSRTVTTVLAQYYYDLRPSHVIMIWLSRRLMNWIPSLDARHLIELIKDSIAYDLRKVDVRSRPRFRARAEANLAVLQRVQAEIPRPVPMTSPASRNGGHGTHDRTTSLISAVEGEAKPTEHPGGSHLTSRNGTTAAAKEEAVYPVQTEDVLQPETPVKQMLEAHSESVDNEEYFDMLLEAYHDDNLDVTKYSAVKVSTPSHESSEQHSPSKVGRNATEGSDYPRSGVRKTEHENKMVLALSQRNYAQVVRLYMDSLTPSGLPLSPFALEVAVEACLRLHKGDPAQATQMLEAAQQAGFNITCATGPMMMHKLWHLGRRQKKDANFLRRAVINYYSLNAKHGWPVKHHVGITAANILINNGHGTGGIEILNAIYLSDWAVDRPLDIVAMTVYVKGYAARRSMSGVQWVMNRVLKENMRIDRKFVASLKAAAGAFAVLRNAAGRYHGLAFRLAKAARTFARIRLRQRVEAQDFGNELVRCLVQHREDAVQPPVRLPPRHRRGREAVLRPSSSAAIRGLRQDSPTKMVMARKQAINATAAGVSKRSTSQEDPSRSRTRRSRQQKSGPNRGPRVEDVISPDGRVTMVRRQLRWRADRHRRAPTTMSKEVAATC